MIRRGVRKHLVGMIVVVLVIAFPGPAIEAADFKLRDLDGRVHHLSDYRGKWVVINFWATWCSPCVHEIPELASFHSRHRPGTVVLGIHFEQTPIAAVKEFVVASKINYPVLRVGQEPLKGLPSTFLVSPEGKYLNGIVGPVTAVELDGLIARYQVPLADSNAMD